MGRGCGRFHFDAPCSPSASDHDVHFHLIPVPIVPATQVGIGPADLFRQLLEDEGFEQVAEAGPLVMPVLDGEVGERGGEAAVDEVQLGCLDEPLGGVAMPRLEAAHQVEPFAGGEVVFHGLALQIEFVAEG